MRLHSISSTRRKGLKLGRDHISRLLLSSSWVVAAANRGENRHDRPLVRLEHPTPPRVLCRRDKAGVVEPKLEQREQDIVDLLDPNRYVLPNQTGLDVRRLSEVLEPLERLLLQCKRVAERLVSRRLDDILGNLCGFFAPRLRPHTTAIVRRMLVKLLETLYEMAAGPDKGRFLVDSRLIGVLRDLAHSSNPDDAVVTEQALQLLDAFRIAEVL